VAGTDPVTKIRGSATPVMKVNMAATVKQIVPIIVLVAHAAVVGVALPV
jgi:hypothetical protein